MSDIKRKFKVLYRDRDPGCPTFCMHLYAYDRHHAEDRFWSSEDDDCGWEILDIVEAGTPADAR